MQCPIIIKRLDRRIAKAIKRKGILAKDVFDVVTVCHVKHEFKKNHAKIIQKAIIFQSPTQQAYLITLEILHYEKDREIVLFVISLLKSLTQTTAKSLK